jgi:hypothetical protein
MRRWSRLIPAVAFAALLGGCGENGLESLTLPDQPSMSGGGYAVGGNRSGDDNTESATTSSTPGSGEIEQPEGESRGGGYAVGGN